MHPWQTQELDGNTPLSSPTVAEFPSLVLLMPHISTVPDTPTQMWLLCLAQAALQIELTGNDLGVGTFLQH